MNFISLDLSAKFLSVSLQTDSNFSYILIENNDLKQGEILLSSIDHLLKLNKLDISSISCIAVPRGPGSFTGLKMCYSIARGLRIPFDIPMVSVNVFEAIRDDIMETNKFCVPIIISRNGFCYGCVFERNRVVKEDFELSFLALKELLQKDFQSKVVLCGPGTKDLDDSIFSGFEIRKGFPAYFKSFMQLAIAKYNAKEFLKENDCPFYLRDFI